MTSSKSKKHKKEKKEKKSKEKKNSKKSDRKEKRKREKTDGEEGGQGARVEQAVKSVNRAKLDTADASRVIATTGHLNTVPTVSLQLKIIAPLTQPVQRKSMAPMTEAQASAAPRPKPAVDAATLEMWRQYNAVADRDRSQYSSDFLKWSDARAGL